MNARIARRGALIAASLSIPAGLAAGHQDDPKALDVRPAWVGPAWRATRDKPLPTAPQGGFASHNVTLRSWLPLGEFGETSSANDCWGYVSPSGREYAILGLQVRGTAFIEITDPGDAQVVDVFDGNDSIWRDIKIYGHHAYVVTEANGGIQVFDLSQIDSGTISLVDTIMTGGSGNSHNVAINEATGRLYRCGGSGNGLRIYSLSNPASPQFVGEWNDRYVHDAQIVTMADGPWAGREVAFCCSGYNSGWVETGLDILDVTDPGNVVELGRIVYPDGEYSHQGWLSADQRYFFLGDELDEGTLGVRTKTFVFDVQDLTDPTLADTFTNGLTATGHNMYVRGNLLLQANYATGLRVFDVSDPLDVAEIAWFDTYPEDDAAGYPALWSNFPYFPSGTVIGSDRNRGLFVWELDLPGLPGDLDGDGSVGFADLVALLGSWGPCPPPPNDCPADLDQNGVVGFSDLLTLLGNWTP